MKIPPIKATQLRKISDFEGFDKSIIFDEMTYIDEMMEKHLESLMKKKEQIIRDKFTEKGFSHLLENLETKRFKRILVENLDNCEKYYADDGSDNGVLIVTFLKENYITDINEQFMFKSEIKYY